MKNIKNIVSYLLLIFFFSSCGGGSSKVTKSELEIVCFENIPSDKDNTYPKVIREIVAPLREVGKSKANFGFSPLTLLRKDLNKEIELNYLNNKAVNYEKILAFERAVNTYFKENKTDSTFNLPTAQNETFEAFLEKNKSKKNVFIYSKEDNKYEGYNIYTSIGDLRSAISKGLTENPEEKIIVVIEPSQVHNEETTTSTSQIIDDNKNNQTKLKEIQSKATTVVSQNDDDYMALYSLALTNVWLSNDHHISFKNLKQASEAAIRKGEATKFSIIIGKDLQIGQQTHNATWKMATHLDDWGSIMELLASNGAKIPDNVHDKKEKNHNGH